MSRKILDALHDISAALERAGVPGLSPYWRAEADRFYLHTSARLLVECVGRGGDKSRTSTMMAIAETLAGDFRIAPGERHYFTHVSENTSEAAKTLGVLADYLRILRVAFTRRDDAIELADQPRGFRVLACRVGAVSGWRCIGWTADECAKWSNDGVDPSAEVVASIRAMTVTHPSARGRIFSSPLGAVGYFYDKWSLGTSADQVTGQAATWLANPSVTEEQTHDLEGDPLKHAREYGAVPSESSDEAMFPALLLDRARRNAEGDADPVPLVQYTAAMDPSLGRNSWTLVVAGHVRRRIQIAAVREWKASAGQTLDPAIVLEWVGTAIGPYGIRTVHTDRFQAEAIASLARRMSLGFEVQITKSTAAQNLERYEGLALRLAEGEVELPRDALVRADLLAVRRRLSGHANEYTAHLQQVGRRHADYAPSLSLAVARVAKARASEIPDAFFDYRVRGCAFQGFGSRGGTGEGGGRPFGGF